MSHSETSLSQDVTADFWEYAAGSMSKVPKKAAQKRATSTSRKKASATTRAESERMSDEPAAKPVSLAPLEFEEAVRRLMSRPLPQKLSDTK